MLQSFNFLPHAIQFQLRLPVALFKPVSAFYGIVDDAVGVQTNLLARLHHFDKLLQLGYAIFGLSALQLQAADGVFFKYQFINDLLFNTFQQNSADLADFHLRGTNRRAAKQCNALPH